MARLRVSVLEDVRRDLVLSPRLATGSPLMVSPIRQLLRDVGAEHLAAQFEREGVTVDKVPELSDDQLKALGASTVGLRVAIQRAAKQQRGWLARWVPW
mmetsp:Transcript_26733/g.54281  ORF Transcript_26733/g.54281 Transcript_26733/m.54281 type:complete len:99 (+) Transcript_26733:283-579(+)